jgi:hypothetical protein
MNFKTNTIPFYHNTKSNLNFFLRSICNKKTTPQRGRKLFSYDLASSRIPLRRIPSGQDTRFFPERLTGKIGTGFLLKNEIIVKKNNCQAPWQRNQTSAKLILETGSHKIRNGLSALNATLFFLPVNLLRNQRNIFKNIASDFGVNKTCIPKGSDLFSGIGPNKLCYRGIRKGGVVLKIRSFWMKSSGCKKKFGRCCALCSVRCAELKFGMERIQLISWFVDAEVQKAAYTLSTTAHRTLRADSRFPTSVHGS